MCHLFSIKKTSKRSALLNYLINIPRFLCLLLNDYCIYFSYDCGFHVLLYIEEFMKEKMYKINKVSIDPFVPQKCRKSYLFDFDHLASRTNFVCL
jgi:hypothetical protein